ncbi:MAG: threonylcarbamoyl-AMP synthase [Bacteroidia bacterium]|nr:threonylcarbamoyl-AMP synthase [Bacteroidia bacterium]
MIGTDIQRAATLLQEGKLVAIPTETVYGLAANAFDANAVSKIYMAKNRPSFNPLIIHTNSIERLVQWGITIPEKMIQLAKHFSPGPITYVVPKSNRIPDIVTAGTDAVAVRIPNHPLTMQLLEKLDFPLAAPSANLSGYVSPTNANHVQQQFGNIIPYILDGGSCNIGVESTIVSFVHPTPTILRYGGIGIEAIQEIIGEVNDKPKENGNTITTDNPIAPGQLARHYATKHKLIHDNPLKHIHNYNLQRIGIISFTSFYPQVAKENHQILSPKGSIEEAAQKLFAAMRKLDEMDIDVILAERFPDKGVGKAINDRLKRASILE